MKKITVLMLIVLFCSACDFFFKADSDGLKIEIGDNGTDNNTNNVKAAFYVYAVGELSPIGVVSEKGLGFESSYMSNVQQFTNTFNNSLTQDTLRVSADNFEVALIDICANGAVVEKSIDFYSDLMHIACDLSGCASHDYDMFSYAERNGFDAYCSAEYLHGVLP